MPHIENISKTATFLRLSNSRSTGLERVRMATGYNR